MTELATVERPVVDAWSTVVVNDVHAYCRGDFRGVLEATYRQHPWVYDALLESPRSSLLRGRRPVVAGELSGRPVVVKRIHHGGLLAFIGRDAFLTPARARAHVELADYLHEHGVPTAPVIFASWRRRYGLVRCEVGFERIEGAIDADHYFFGRDELPECWELRASEIGRLVAQLHRIRFLHADLNLMNFLFAPKGETYILDLDKSTPPRESPSSRACARNLERLERSIRKQGRNHLSTVVERIIGKMRSSYRAALVVLQAVAASEILLLSDLVSAVERLPLV